MLKALKIRLYPNKIQKQSLAQSFGNVRWFWNYSLNFCQQTYEETGKNLNRSAIQSLLPNLKKQDETIWLKETYSQCLQVVALNLSNAYKNFFEGRAEKPKFKSLHGKQTLTYPQNVKFEGNYLKLPKIGLVKAKITKKVSFTLRTVTISKNCAGQYFASLLYDDGNKNPELTSLGNQIALDLGITHFAIDSNGNKYSNPRWLSEYQVNLKIKQQKLTQKKKGSNNRLKAKLAVAKIHNKIANCRADFHHKLSRKIVDENQVVVVEDLNVKGMIKNRRLAKAISQVGFGNFCTMLKYKAEQLGKIYHEINRFFPSSKTCNCCAYKLEKLTLDVRSWTCPSCNTSHDRDINASKNILDEGLRNLGLERPSKPIAKV